MFADIIDIVLAFAQLIGLIVLAWVALCVLCLMCITVYVMLEWIQDRRNARAARHGKEPGRKSILDIPNEDNLTFLEELDRAAETRMKESTTRAALSMDPEEFSDYMKNQEARRQFGYLPRQPINDVTEVMPAYVDITPDDRGNVTRYIPDDVDITNFDAVLEYHNRTKTPSEGVPATNADTEYIPPFNLKEPEEDEVSDTPKSEPA